MTTNLERIRQMNSEELAEFLKFQSCLECPVLDDYYCGLSLEFCIKAKKQWLEQESEE